MIHTTWKLSQITKSLGKFDFLKQISMKIKLVRDPLGHQFDISPNKPTEENDNHVRIDTLKI